MRSRLFPALLLLAGLAALAGCGKSTVSAPPTPPPAPAPSANALDPVHGHLLRAQPKLPTIKVWVGDQELITEIARSDVEIATGMMFRTNMLENEAMIFVFDGPQPRSFYMRNCFVPLSGAYISPSGEILEIIRMEPHNEAGIESKSGNIQFVLEVPQGWFARHNISTGAVVRTERGSLRKTFFKTD